MRTRAASTLLLVLFACAQTDAPAEGWISTSARDARDPIAAFRAGVARLAELPPYQPETENLARDLVALLARPEFDAYPVARGVLRPLVMHGAHPTDGVERRLVFEEIDDVMRVLPRRNP